MVLMGLTKMPHGDGDAVARAIRRGTAWFLGMQSRDGGWGSFEADNDHLLLNNIPFADHRALLDPSTEDLTGRGLELLGTLDYALDHPKATRALEFIKRTQHPDGPWLGRWGVNYIYGTWSVLRGLRAIGERMDAPYVRRAVRWLIAKQNADGGWGETLASYEDPSLAGRGASIPTQSAWALLGLLAAGQGRHRAVQRGVEYLLRTQQPDGRWEDLFWNGTGFPGIFYLKYHLYATYFPLWALGVYRREAHGVGHVGRATVAEVARGE
jgi:squalene-hopene/tetraprenyl-beta-curcumene cyclase